MKRLAATFFTLLNRRKHTGVIGRKVPLPDTTEQRNARSVARYHEQRAALYVPSPGHRRDLHRVPGWPGAARGSTTLQTRGD